MTREADKYDEISRRMEELGLGKAWPKPSSGLGRPEPTPPAETPRPSPGAYSYT